MRRRAIISVLIGVAGTLAASAAPPGAEVRSSKFQPGQSVSPTVLRASSLTVMRPAAIKVTVKQPAVSRPSTAAVSPAAVRSAR